MRPCPNTPTSEYASLFLCIALSGRLNLDVHIVAHLNVIEGNILGHDVRSSRGCRLREEPFSGLYVFYVLQSLETPDIAIHRISKAANVRPEFPMEWL